MTRRALFLLIVIVGKMGAVSIFPTFFSQGKIETAPFLPPLTPFFSAALAPSSSVPKGQAFVQKLKYIVPTQETEKERRGPVGTIVPVRVEVSFTYPGRYSSGQVELRKVTLNEEYITSIRRTAERALEGINLGLGPEGKLYSAQVEMGLELDSEGHIERYWVADLIPLGQGSVPLPNDEEIPGLVAQIIKEDLDESHIQLFSLIRNDSTYLKLIEELRQYLSQDIETNQDPKLLLKQERAIIVLGDSLWILKGKGDGILNGHIDQDQLNRLIEVVSKNPQTRAQIAGVLQDPSLKFTRENDYLVFINQFLKAANEKELEDFERSVKALLGRMPQKRSEGLEFQVPDKVHISASGMRFGISSANASDNWTNAKLKGGMVLNAAIDLDGQPPIRVEVERLPQNVIELESLDSLPSERPKRVTLDAQNISEFFSYTDPADPLRMLKYAIVFVRIAGYEEKGIYEKAPQRILDEIGRFTGGGGIRVKLINRGPSRSGFASSSAVAMNLLNALYRASGQDGIASDEILLGSMALLFENRLGLKSGRQDVDGLLPGIKDIIYPPTGGFLMPDLRRLQLTDAQLAELSRNLMMVDSSITRPAATDLRRGLNVRHLALLSRDPQGFLAIRKSYGIHPYIVEAFKSGNWQALGQLFLDYMSLREKIDPGATQSLYDARANEKVLRRLFDPLLKEGLIYGGMFTGAMGGGVAMLVLTEEGKQKVFTVGPRKVDSALQALKGYRVKDIDGVGDV